MAKSFHSSFSIMFFFFKKFNVILSGKIFLFSPSTDFTEMQDNFFLSIPELAALESAMTNWRSDENVLPINVGWSARQENLLPWLNGDRINRILVAMVPSGASHRRWKRTKLSTWSTFPDPTKHYWWIRVMRYTGKSPCFTGHLKYYSTDRVDLRNSGGWRNHNNEIICNPRSSKNITPPCTIVLWKLCIPQHEIVITRLWIVQDTQSILHVGYNLCVVGDL